MSFHFLISHMVPLQTAFAQSSTPPAPGGGASTATTSTPTNVPVAGAPPQPSTVQMLAPFALMFVVIYFMIIRPQQKKVKEHQETIGKLKHGDEIVTNSGIFGKVTGVAEKVLTVEIADGVRIKMLKGQVASVNPDLKPQKTTEKGA